MTTISQPKVTYNLLPGTGRVLTTEQRVLIIGQKLPAGTATSGDLVQDIGNNGEQVGLFGEDAHITYMIDAFKKINKNTPLDAISLDDNGAAVDATGTVAFTGTATEAGTLSISIGSEKVFTFDIAVADGDTATDVGDALVAALTSTAPVTGINTTGSVALTAKNGGEVGNSIGLRVQGSVAGVSVALTAFASGATNPVITNIFDVIGDQRYQTIVWPNTYTLSVLTDLLDARVNVNNAILDGVGITTQVDTFSNLLAAGNAENSLSLVIMGQQLQTGATQKGGEFVELDDVISSQLAALRALRLTERANIARYVVNPSTDDSFGGDKIRSLPYHNTPLFDLIVSPPGIGFNETEVDQLTDAGITLFGNNVARNTVILNSVVTTRKTNSAGQPEETFKYLNNVDVSSGIREIYFNRTKQTYAQYRLTEGALVPRVNIVNEAAFRAFLKGIYQELGDLALVEKGEDSRSFYDENLDVIIDKATGTISVDSQVLIVTQLREVIGGIQIQFSAQTA